MVDLIYEKTKIKVYTTQIDKEKNPAGLANSIHLAYQLQDGSYRPVNNEYGLLFAKGDVTKQNVIVPKGFVKPKIFLHENMGKPCYGLLGFVIDEYEDVSKWELSDSCELQLFFTNDFIRYEEKGTMSYRQFLSEYPQALLKEELEIDSDLCRELAAYYGETYSVMVQLPEIVEVNRLEEVNAVKAQVLYSDGSVDQKSVIWDFDHAKQIETDTYEVSGTVIREQFSFPMTQGFADPVVFSWEGKYYFISTNDNTDNIGIYLREGDTVAELFTDDAKMHLILPYDEKRHLIQTFWAPEFHVIGEELYILFAVSGEQWGPQCHMMKWRKGIPLTKQEAWEDPIKVMKSDQTPLVTDGISLDMTYLHTKRASYLVWSERYGIGTDLDTGSMICIATIDDKKPWILTSEPVLLSRPLYSWENVDHTINNEGPYAFSYKGKVFLTYSGGSANGFTYATGLLTAGEEDDLLHADQWEKSPYPVMQYQSIEDVYGPGHNAFFINEDGKLMVTYHGVTAMDAHYRCGMMHRVHFDTKDRPVFHLSAEKDLADKMRTVTIKVKIKEKG